jgi:hypothetical protein
MIDVRNWLPALFLALPLLGVGAVQARDRDPLDDVKARLAIEAQRVEKEFAQERAAAYKLVRSDSPRLIEATEKLQTLLAMVRNDTALESKRRETLIVTLKFDLGKVKEIAGERRRFASAENSPARSMKQDARRTVEESSSTNTGRRKINRDIASLIEGRGRSLADARSDRRSNADGFGRTMRDVDKSAVPDPRNYVLPKDWAEKSKKRSVTQPLTAKEKAILKALNTTIDAEFEGHTFEEVLDYLRKKTGVDIAVDKRSMDEASVTYKTPINLKLRGTLRTVLRRMLGDLGLAYIVKSETIQIMSQERAKSETTTRIYYIADLLPLTDLRLPPLFRAAVMIQTINQLINTITQTIEPKSWQVNNPDAVGTIVFNPAQMTLVVKQSAEIHYSLAGYR